MANAPQKNAFMRIGVIPLLILFVSSFSHQAWGQSCGCAATGDCPVFIPSGSTTQVCYEITDAFNDDLSDPNQGICGVAVHFTNSNVGQHVLTLCSPDGTCIDLTGSAAPCTVPSIFGNWNILFEPCDSIPSPDTVATCNYPSQWTNCPNDCDWGNAFYDGTYHPFGGCLEDFNSGPINGQWCLTMDNSGNTNGGNILDFEIIVCDDSGFLCCEADAGALNLIPDIISCEGDSSLLLMPTPDYGATQPAPNEYGYFWMISQNNEIIAYTEVLDMTSYTMGTYEVCGLSYLLADLSNIPGPNTGQNSTVLNDNLESASPLFCGDVSDNCFIVTIAEPIPEQDITATICEGEIYMVGDSMFTQSGAFTVALLSENSCDSTINLTLNVLNTDTTQLFEVICEGDAFTVGDSIYSETGVFETLLPSSTDCDSVVILDLTIIPNVDTIIVDTICMGESFMIGTMAFTATGAYSETIMSSQNCDSTINLNLTVIDVNATIDAPNIINCNSPIVQLAANNSTNSPDATFEWTTSNGVFESATNQMIVDVSSAGTYYFEVTLYGCSAVDSVEVNNDLALPTANAGLPDTLNCLDTNLLLDGTGSVATAGNMLNYNWYAQNGCPIANANTATPTIACPDEFFLEVINSVNGCRDTTSVLIIQDIAPPTANAGLDTFLTCLNNCIDLDGTLSLPSNLLNYSWTTLDGNIKSGAFTATPAIDQVGTYALTVTNTQNFCQATDEVEVTINVLVPDVSIQLPDTLTCQDTLINLFGVINNIIPNASIEWGGGIIAGQGTATATVNAAGAYTFMVTNEDNGCVDSASVIVNESIALPAVNAINTINTEINCSIEEILLGSDNNPQGPEFIYEWTTIGGSIDNSNNPQQPFATAGGLYILTITNAETGCFDSDSITITENFIFPTAQVNGGNIDCVNSTFTFTAFNPSLLSGWSFEWIFNGETVLEGLNENELTVDYPGEFTLIVTNNLGGFCKDTTTAEVVLTVTPPAVNAGNDVFLDCMDNTAMLQGIDVNNDPNINYEWAGPSADCFLTSPTDLTTTVSCPGEYILTATDTSTNCITTDTVQVLVDTLACTPTIALGTDVYLNCYTPDSIQVLAMGDSGGRRAISSSNTIRDTRLQTPQKGPRGDTSDLPGKSGPRGPAIRSSIPSA